MGATWSDRNHCPMCLRCVLHPVPALSGHLWNSSVLHGDSFGTVHKSGRHYLLAQDLPTVWRWEILFVWNVGRETDRKSNRWHKCRLLVLQFQSLLAKHLHTSLFLSRRCRICQSFDHRVQCDLLHSDPCMGILLPLLVLQCTTALDKLWQHLEHWYEWQIEKDVGQ